MKLKIGLVIGLLTSTFMLSAQYQINGDVIDAESGLAIPYVCIGFPEEGRGVVSDKDGLFQITSESEDVTVSITCLGYESQLIEWTKLEELGTVSLTSAAYDLQPVEITSFKTGNDTLMLGQGDDTRGMSIGFASAQLGTQIGAPIFIDKPTHLLSAHFIINHAKGDSMTFRVNILDFTNEKIGGSILNESVIIKEKQRKGKLSVDLSEYGVVVDHPVLLSLEWLEDDGDKGNQGITFDSKKKGKIRGVYMKYSVVGEYDNIDYLSKRVPSFFLIGVQ